MPDLSPEALAQLALGNPIPATIEASIERLRSTARSTNAEQRGLISNRDLTPGSMRPPRHRGTTATSRREPDSRRPTGVVHLDEIDDEGTTASRGLGGGQRGPFPLETRPSRPPASHRDHQRRLLPGLPLTLPFPRRHVDPARDARAIDEARDAFDRAVNAESPLIDQIPSVSLVDTIAEVLGHIRTDGGTPLIPFTGREYKEFRAGQVAGVAHVAADTARGLVESGALLLNIDAAFSTYSDALESLEEIKRIARQIDSAELGRQASALHEELGKPWRALAESGGFLHTEFDAFDYGEALTRSLLQAEAVASVVQFIPRLTLALARTARRVTLLHRIAQARSATHETGQVKALGRGSKSLSEQGNRGQHHNRPRPRLEGGVEVPAPLVRIASARQSRAALLRANRADRLAAQKHLQKLIDDTGDLSKASIARLKVIAKARQTILENEALSVFAGKIGYERLPEGVPNWKALPEFEDLAGRTTKAQIGQRLDTQKNPEALVNGQVVDVS